MWNEATDACYQVDARDGVCSCPDSEYNLAAGEKCKHQLRVAYVTGARDLPAVPTERIDYVLRSQHERYAERQAADAGADGNEEQEGGR